METNQPAQAPTPTNPNTQPENTSPTTQTPLPTPKTKKPWLLISLAVLLLGVTGTFAFKYYQAKQQLDKERATLTPSQQLIINDPSPTTNSVKEWEMYSKDNYSFRYPQGLFPIKYAPPLELGVHFFLSEAEAKEAFNCFVNKKGTIQSPCGSSQIFQVLFDKFQSSSDKSLLNQYNTSTENSLLSEYIDEKNRKWIIEGPVWGMGPLSSATAQFFQDGNIYNISSQVDGRTYGQYLNKELIIENPKDTFNAELLINTHKDLLKQILSSLEF